MTMTHAEAAVRRSGKFLTFALDAEEYGVEILKVNEIIGTLPITRVPGLPSHVGGVVNLRGKVIPIVYLRRKFGMAESTSEESCIVVVQVEQRAIGIVVDKVSEVVNIATKDVEDVPEFGAGVDTEFLLGVAKIDGRVRLLLDIDKVLGNDVRAAVTEEMVEA
jgi:purine-binding chemotaxis protein CheW